MNDLEQRVLEATNEMHTTKAEIAEDLQNAYDKLIQKGYTHMQARNILRETIDNKFKKICKIVD